MKTASWTITAARSKLGAVIERAQTDGPQAITKNARTVAIVVSAEEWKRWPRRVGTLADFFAASPLRGSGIDIIRTIDGSR